MKSGQEPKVSLMDPYTVRLIAEETYDDCQQASDERISNQGRYVKLTEANGCDAYATKRQFYYLLAGISVVAVVVLIYLVVGLTKLDGLLAIHEAEENNAQASFSRNVSLLLEREQINLEEQELAATNSREETTSRTTTSRTSTTSRATTTSRIQYLNPHIDDDETDSTEQFKGNETIYDKIRDRDQSFSSRISADCPIRWHDKITGTRINGTTVSRSSVSSFFVARARHLDGIIPGESGSFTRMATVDYQGEYIIKTEYQVLTAPSSCVEWVKPIRTGQLPPNAIPGGFEPITGTVLYICYTTNQGLPYYGWIKANTNVCHFASSDKDGDTAQYEVLTAKI